MFVKRKAIRTLEDNFEESIKVWEGFSLNLYLSREWGKWSLYLRKEWEEEQGGRVRWEIYGNFSIAEWDHESEKE